MTDWNERARAAAVRKSRMMSFGPYTRGLLVQGHHGLFVVDPEDSSVTGDLLATGTYAEHELALATSFIRPEGDVLIVGTHIGGLAVPLSKRCKNMDAIEANPDTQYFLKSNLLLNQCNNVNLHPVAASDSRDPITFLKNRDNSGGSKRKPVVEHIHYVYDQPETVTVEAWPLDQRLSRQAYDLIILDVEGSEYFALKGMQRILEKSSNLAMEYLPHHIKDVAGVTVSQMCEYLTPHFNWLYIPGRGDLVSNDQFQTVLQDLYDNGKGYDAIYFMKSVSSEWKDAWLK